MTRAGPIFIDCSEMGHHLCQPCTGCEPALTRAPAVQSIPWSGNGADGGSGASVFYRIDASPLRHRCQIFGSGFDVLKSCLAKLCHSRDRSLEHFGLDRRFYPSCSHNHGRKLLLLLENNFFLQKALLLHFYRCVQVLLCKTSLPLFLFRH